MQLKELYANLTRSIPNYRVRDSQLQMMLQIEACFKTADPSLQDGSNICLIEAPTGTGKSLAYLLPGIVAAQKLGKKLVVATATKTLQNQLMEKDIPSLIRHSGIKFAYAMAKGRSNYLCPYQLELASQNLVGDMFNNAAHEREQLQQIRHWFNQKIWDGDLDLAPVRIDNKVRANITIDKDRCLAYSCPYNQKEESSCPFYLNREKLKTCEVIVTNHSLLLADINLGAGSVLPCKPDDYLLCVDEGHNLADNALGSFSKSFELKHTSDNCHNLSKLIYNPGHNGYLLAEVAICDAILEQVTDLTVILDEIWQLLRQNVHLFTDNQLILNDYLNPNLGNAFHERFVSVAYIASELYANLTKVADIFKEKLKSGADFLIENNLSKLGFYLSSIESILLTSQYIINQDDSRYNANAKWIEIKSVSGQEDFVINAGLTHVGNILSNKLWLKVHSVLITSATLAIGNNFKYYLHKLGLNLLDKVITCKLSSSFEYSKQAQIVVPRFKCAPDFTTRDQFTKELAEYLAKTLNYTDGFGTLVLFFNRNQLQEVYAALPKEIQRYILLQTEFVGSQRLLNEHKKNIDKGQPSVIFGLNSFAEGVDLPALYCIHVIITKLPFETHKNPHNMVQEYWIRYEKGNYFLEVALSETCIRLIQAAGRLIRDENDYGQLSICDNRLVTKPYGTILLDALPNFERRYRKEFLNEAFNKVSKT
ncbi:MAG: ATP-dependent helicase DinG [Pseudomonadota bacterium]|nr:ATP-dependent helicase DinG [Pseudomonadota bacterium]